MSYIVTKFVLHANTSSSTIAAISTSSLSAAATSSATAPSAVAVATVSESMRREAMDVVVAKIICLLILTILSVLCGLLPLRLLIHTPHLFTRGRNSVDYFLCGLRLFSGGIYLATCFLHLMPDTRVKMDSVMKNMGSNTTYAVPELLVMSGFYAVVFVEQIIKALYVKAQQSDVNRKLRKAKRAHQEPEAKRQPVQVFRSTLDEDVHPGETQLEHRPYRDDEEDEDDDDNVLIEDEEDLSFEETDSDKNSVDSITQVKENLIGREHGTEKHDTQKSGAPALMSSGHSHSLNNIYHQQSQPLHHSKPPCHSEPGTQVLRTFGQHSPMPKVTMASTRPVLSSGPPIIHTRIQRHAPLESSNHNHYTPQPNHVTRYDEQQPKAQYSQKEPHHPHSQQFHQIQSPEQQGQDGVWSDVQISSHSDDLDENPDQPHSGSHQHVTVCVERARGSETEPHTFKSTADHDRSADSGIFSARRDCETVESDTLKPLRTSSRDVSFDKISESSSVLQDIQVKRVVDELSRTDDSSKAHLRSIIYIMALSFHGIFEGMALGLQSMKSSVWSLCFAIVVHRCVLAFRLGMDLCRGDEKQGTAFLCIGTFTLISTLGIIIGIIISSGASLYSNVSVPEAILQSLATGTIFYIVFFDILFKDLDGKDDLKRVSSSFVGFSMMAIVFAITRS
ncbi:PAX-interacting protein 1 [Biomphalaria pfeifferi]|uniref:PAX-interacting protein 1 n=1 Tax=Biomphalaria pfeifferi TaxID=112525 RepID=A0AAD8F803_BIOPF|nr:PAX-interacting protein 1 [Biomphalaria pfeifferi]